MILTINYKSVQPLILKKHIFKCHFTFVMSNDQSNITFTDDDIQLNDETALLLEKLIDLKGECFVNIFIGKLFLFYLN